MSLVKISARYIQSGFAIPRTHVFVDGKFAYQSQNHPDIKKEQIEILMSLMDLEVEVVSGGNVVFKK